MAYEQDIKDMRAIAVGGNEGKMAMKHVFDQCYRDLVRLLRWRYADLSREDAEDFVSTALLKAFNAAASYRGESTVCTWIGNIAVNQVKDRYRHTNKFNHESLDASADNDESSPGESLLHELAARVSVQGAPGSELANKQMQDCVQSHFDAFRKRYPEPALALYQRYVHDESVREVAEFMGKKESAMRQYLSDWNRKLRAFLVPCFKHLKEA